MEQVTSHEDNEFVVFYLYITQIFYFYSIKNQDI